MLDVLAEGVLGAGAEGADDGGVEDFRKRGASEAAVGGLELRLGEDLV